MFGAIHFKFKNAKCLGPVNDTVGTMNSDGVVWFI